MYRLYIHLSDAAKSIQRYDRASDLLRVVQDEIKYRIKQDGHFLMMIVIEDNITIGRSQLANAFGIPEMELYRRELMVGISAVYCLSGDQAGLKMADVMSTDMTHVHHVRNRFLY